MISLIFTLFFVFINFLFSKPDTVGSISSLNHSSSELQRTHTVESLQPSELSQDVNESVLESPKHGALMEISPRLFCRKMIHY